MKSLFSLIECIFLTGRKKMLKKSLISVVDYIIIIQMQLVLFFKHWVILHIAAYSSNRMDICVIVSIVLSFRRQRARERQQKLLAEFASRQKSFMETAMDVGKKRPAHLSCRVVASVLW